MRKRSLLVLILGCLCMTGSACAKTERELAGFEMQWSARFSFECKRCFALTLNWRKHKEFCDRQVK